MTTRKTFVRCCTDKTVFEINPKTLDAMTCGRYDPYCYVDELPDVEYIEYSDWLQLRNKQWDKMRYENFRK